MVSKALVITWLPSVMFPDFSLVSSRCICCTECADCTGATGEGVGVGTYGPFLAASLLILRNSISGPNSTAEPLRFSARLSGRAGCFFLLFSAGCSCCLSALRLAAFSRLRFSSSLRSYPPPRPPRWPCPSRLPGFPDTLPYLPPPRIF